MSASFAQMLKEEGLSELNTQPGTVIKGKILLIDDTHVLVDAGMKSEAWISKDQFRDANGDLTINVGDAIDVALDAIEDNYGGTRLSRERAKRMEAWTDLERAAAEGTIIRGVITGKVKGGFTVDLAAVRAFLPGSLVDVRPLRDTTFLEGKELEFKVIKIDVKRNNIVVSRRAVIEAESSAERDALLENLHEGQMVKGIVKNLTDYGAFIDLGGIDGLLHITDMSWKRIKHPSEMIAVGDELQVKILKFDTEKNRVSLGLKQLGDDPWKNMVAEFPEGTRIHGRVTNIADYGCFVELREGVEGLVHVSEMDWTNKNVNPAKVVQLGQEVDVMVLEVDQERRRISLGLKQCIENPWTHFAQTHQRGDKVKGKIKSVTDFGIFIGLDGNIDGLIHLSDLSWNKSGEEAAHEFKKGDEVEAIVLAVDAERERISLGMKQLDDDPFSSFTATCEKGAVLKGTVTEVDEKGVTVRLAEDVLGFIRPSELAEEKVQDVSRYAEVGKEIEAAFMGVDRKNRLVNLSLRLLNQAQEREARAAFDAVQEADRKTTTIGDLIKEKLNK